MSKVAVIGIGNPGAQYAGTFHNVGAAFVEWLGERHGASWNALDHVRYATLHDWHDVILGQTLTFMNVSGVGVAELVDYRKLRGDIVVIAHDDTDLPVGEILLKQGGGTAGHNGIASIYETLPAQTVWRLKIGARPERFAGPPHIKAENFVLNRLGPQEQELLVTQAFPEAEHQLELLLGSI